jgi:recombination protein RecA
MYNEGISKAGDVLDIATELEIITKRGAFFAFGDTRLGQGRENAKEFLKGNPDLLAQIEGQIRENAAAAAGMTKLGSTALPPAESDEESEEE